MKESIARRLAGSIGAIGRIETNKENGTVTKGNLEWLVKHKENIREIERNHLPSGAGIDDGTHVDLDKSTEEKLVFNTAYHHMTEGVYDEWTYHTIIVTPSFHGFNIRITGPNRNDIKEYLHQVFYDVLSQEIE